MTISAKIIADSISPVDIRITTFELEYPRFIHSEFMTHRMFSRNAASSRAIPVDKVIEQVRTNPAMPIHWGRKQAGMQAKEELSVDEQIAAKAFWLEAAQNAADSAEKMLAGGWHKQWVNRILEPFVNIKVVMTATEFNNWYWLRYHADAQPEIHELAKLMNHAADHSDPVRMRENQWHVPYVKNNVLGFNQFFYDEYNNEISLEQALKISASCCAQVSYRKQDTSLEKAELIYDRLIESEPCHASPIEHQAKAMSKYHTVDTPGVTHQDDSGDLWSGNFRGWIQNRQLIPGNVKKG